MAGKGCVRGRTRGVVGDGSRSTMVSSASNISFSRSLGRRLKTGGVGIGGCFTLLDRLSDFLEKIPEVQVWYFRFREEELASPEEVLGLA